MAWQSGPGGGAVGGMAGGEQNGIQAYTLQGRKLQRTTGCDTDWCAGVMRFLQTEWHRHERDRNAWEIEREEMKSRIAILEGDARTGKGLRTSLERHIKLLEKAIRKERDKSKGIDSDITELTGQNQDNLKDRLREDLKRGGTLAMICLCALADVSRIFRQSHQPS
jgi:striatin 1/3/4